MFRLPVELPLASDLRKYISDKKEKEFKKVYKQLFYKTAKLIKDSAEAGYYNCKLSSDYEIVFGDFNRGYINEDYIPLFIKYYEDTFVESGYDIYKLGDHSIFISWSSNKKESEDDS